VRSSLTRSRALCSVAALVCFLSATRLEAQDAWISVDIGAPTAAGSDWGFADIHLLSGVGAGIEGSRDQLHFVYQSVPADVDFKACLSFVGGVDPGLNVGLMIRQSLAPGAPMAAAVLSPATGATLMTRTAPGTPASAGDYSAAASPLCMRIVRSGNRFTAYTSPDGAAWMAIGTASVPMSGAVYVGMLLSSHSDYLVAQGIFSAPTVTATAAPPDVTTPPSPDPTPVPTPDPTPAPMPNPTPVPTPDPTPVPMPDPTPIPVPAPPPVPVTDPAPPPIPTPPPTPAPTPPPTPPPPTPDPTPGAGFISLPVPVNSLTSAWSSLDIGGSRTAGSESVAPGTISISAAGSDIGGSADQFRFVYQSVAGDAELMARVVSFGADGPGAKAGLMVRASLGASATNAFVGVTASGRVTFSARPFEAGATIETAGPFVTTGGFVRVKRSGYVLTAYWSEDGLSWTVVGTQTIPMAATVSLGLAVMSQDAAALATAVFGDVVGGAAHGASNQPPVVQITSPATSAVSAGTVTVAAAASDPDGTVARVDFFEGPRLIGSANTAPFQVAWQGVGDGVYILTAVVIDDAGATASTTITVVVGNGPSGPGSVYPSTPPVPKVPIRLSFTPSPDQDAGVTSYAVAVHRDGDALSDPPVASGSLGMPAVTDGTITVNIDSTMDRTHGGTYYVVVRAIGPGGESTDAVSGLFSK
jgi:regulation of enolase protein 1 (concanavalin A-like superfamily)